MIMGSKTQMIFGVYKLVQNWKQQLINKTQCDSELNPVLMTSDNANSFVSNVLSILLEPKLARNLLLISVYSPPRNTV